MIKMKILITISLILILLITGCQIQCSECPELDCSECPQQKCPDLDCSTCPKQIETKTITKYQCYDGTMKDKLSDCTKTEFQKSQEECPQLNEINVFEWRSILGSTYMRLNNSYNGYINEGYNTTWLLYVQCEKGREEGDNINWWYCGKYSDPLLDTIHLKKLILDDKGAILQIITKKAYSVYDENFNFEKTICYS